MNNERPYEFTGGTLKDTFEKFKKADRERFMESGYIGKHPEDFKEDGFDPLISDQTRIVVMQPPKNAVPSGLKVDADKSDLARYRQPLTEAEEKSMDKAIMERIKIARKLRRLRRNK